jgi:biofilm PGA synthesis N-glycosyltransferase PgaC
MKVRLEYSLITTARNEAAFIEETLKSVLRQSVLPVKWIVVSDGSTDGTDEIVKRYAAGHGWIELMRMPERRERHFGGKAHAFKAAYATLRHLQFQAIGNLDADVCLDRDYFAYLLDRLAEDPALGITGTAFREPGRTSYDYRFASDVNVPGPCQLFRRECFEEIGGYAPLKHGGVDHFALIAARMKGWTTKAYTERSFLHLRPMGAAKASGYRATFFWGLKDYRVGNHPLWELFRAVYRLTERPVLLNGLLLGAGYLYGALRRLPREAPAEMIAFHRREQLRRLKMLLKGGNRSKQATEANRLGASTADDRFETAAPVAEAPGDSPSAGAALELPGYVLITSARNEAQFLESTIESVLAQTVRPLKWVIVSDGSTDETDAIASKYAASHSWIELMRMPERSNRTFGGKARAVNAAYASVRHLDFQVVTCLDADISISPGHFAYLLRKLAGDPALGVVGAPFRETSGEIYDYRFVSVQHVSGACQVFRRKCFEDIKGYTPLKAGGVDHVAVIRARMEGWKTRTFMGAVCLHHRKIGSAEFGTVHAWFRTGVKDYCIGGHPLWEVSRLVYRLTQKPFIVGSLALGAGYFWSMITRAERSVPPEIEAFHRHEQMLRLKALFASKPAPKDAGLQRPA